MKLHTTIIAIVLTSLTFVDTRGEPRPVVQAAESSFRSIKIAQQEISEIQVRIDWGRPTVVIVTEKMEFAIPSKFFDIEESKAPKGENYLALEFAQSLRKAQTVTIEYLITPDVPERYSAKIAVIKVVY